VPPLSGFFAKLLVIRAGLEAEAHALVFVALAVGLLTVFSMTKIWSEAFAKPATARQPAPHRSPRAAVAACAILGLLTVALGIGAQGLLELAEGAAGQLLHPDAYVAAVLGGRR
jgi:multicomponent Na+:H+ antiporter subunit D